ncbi:MAG TPA: glycine cleavage system protein GcvH [Geobacteraceae bacterium]|nr:glycine cleavage system protein GcvH [Geobacteraceae bacterium]
MAIYFTRDHEWVRIDGPTGIVGITGYAVEQLGDITFVELPRPGREAKQAEVLCAIESVKAASDIFAPVSGKVTEVNARVESEPEIVNQSPEDEGWLVRLEIADVDEVKSLMSREQYEEYLGGLP